MPIDRVTPETHALGTFAKRCSLLPSVFISSNALLFDILVIMLCQTKKKEHYICRGNSASSLEEGEWRMMLAAENLHLELGRCFEGGGPDITTMLLS